MGLRKRLLFALALLVGLIVISVTGYRILGGESVTFLQVTFGRLGWG